MDVVTKLVWPLLCLMNLKDVGDVFFSPGGPLPDAILQIKLRKRCFEYYLLSYLTANWDPFSARLRHNL